MKEEPRINEDLTKLPEPVKRLWKLVGKWKASGEIHQDNQRYPVEGEFKASFVAGGFGVEAKSDFDIEGIGKYEDLETYGYDPGPNQYHLYAVTNEGHTHDHVGDALPEEILDLRYRGMQEGKPYREDVIIKIRGENEVLFKAVEYVDDEQISTFDVVLTK